MGEMTDRQTGQIDIVIETGKFVTQQRESYKHACIEIYTLYYVFSLSVYVAIIA